MYKGRAYYCSAWFPQPKSTTKRCMFERYFHAMTAHGLPSHTGCSPCAVHVYKTKLAKVLSSVLRDSRELRMFDEQRHFAKNNPGCPLTDEHKSLSKVFRDKLIELTNSTKQKKLLLHEWNYTLYSLLNIQVHVMRTHLY